MRVVFSILSTSPKYDPELFRIRHTLCIPGISTSPADRVASNPTLFPHTQATVIRQIMPRLQLVPPPHSVQPVLDRCSIDSSGNCG